MVILFLTTLPGPANSTLKIFKNILTKRKMTQGSFFHETPVSFFFHLLYTIAIAFMQP